MCASFACLYRTSSSSSSDALLVFLALVLPRPRFFGIVGLIAAAATLSTLWLVGRVRLAHGPAVSAEAISLAAAAEATADAGEPFVGTVEAG